MFSPNLQKALQIVRYLNKKQVSTDLIVKILFESEVEHLNLHGRPVTGIIYVKQNDLILSKEIENLLNSHESKKRANLNLLSISDLTTINQKINEFRDCNIDQIIEHNKNLSFWDSISNSIDYKKTITNPEVLLDLEELDPFRIVI